MQSTRTQDGGEQATKARVPTPSKEPRDFPTHMSGNVHNTLHSLYVTEKSTMLQEQGCYTFYVFPRATAPSVRKAVEEVYGVHVTDVHMVKLPAKHVRRGKFEGIRMRYPKAIVKLKKGESIEMVPG